MQRGGVAVPYIMSKSKYILPVRQDLIREIEKRGIHVNRKDENGIVKKKKSIGDKSSPFGWGPVDDTIPVVKKDLDNIRRNIGMIISQVVTKSYLEEEPLFKAPTGKRVRDVIIEEQEVHKKLKISQSVQKWYNFMSDSLKNGSIGLLPECYQNGLPTSIDEFMCTNIGHTIDNYSKFLKNEI